MLRHKSILVILVCFLIPALLFANSGADKGNARED